MPDFSLTLHGSQEVRAIDAPVAPLETITARADASGTLIAFDAKNREYARIPFSKEASFQVSGALGWHRIALDEPSGTTLATAGFQVTCKTGIEDSTGYWKNFLNQLEANFYTGPNDRDQFYFLQNRLYFVICNWIRNHLFHVIGMRYYKTQLKDTVDLFANYQADDGMILDFINKGPGGAQASRFPEAKGKFFKSFHPENFHGFRVPLENDVEYLFAQSVYQTWKTTGDDRWLADRIGNAERALRYNMTSPYCWSEKYQLIKRPLTLDTWDFMPANEATRVGGDIMNNDPERSRYGIFHGDNTGFAQACRQLAEMYRHLGRKEQAEYWDQTGEAIWSRICDLAWNDRFFVHWIPEDGDFTNVYGVDMQEQVSLSNAIALTRGLPHENAKAIIQTYQGIREKMDPSAPGEFFSMFPPFPKGFHLKTWHYVNGGVFPFIGSDLAYGAFQHGFETYGVDILKRLKALLDKHHGVTPYYHIGTKEPAPERGFTTLDLLPQLNVDISCEGAEGVPGWTNRNDGNDFSIMPTGHQVYHDIPFDLTDPATHGRRSAIGLALDPAYQQTTTIPVGQKAASLYFLHTVSGASKNQLIGWVDLEYEDGSSHRQYVFLNQHVCGFWYPQDVPYNRVEGWRCRVAFSGDNGKATVGHAVWGLDNPRPELAIKSVSLHHARNAGWWFVFGITLCDAPVWFEADDAIFGVLHPWHAASGVCALLQGLSGIENAGGTGLQHLRCSPRWAATEETEIMVTAHFPENDEYARARWQLSEKMLTLQIAYSGETAEGSILIPADCMPVAIRIQGEPSPLRSHRIEDSLYVDWNYRGLGPVNISIDLEAFSADQPPVGNSRLE